MNYRALMLGKGLFFWGDIALIVGFCMLPFATGGTETNSPIFPLGLPPLAIVALIGYVLAARNPLSKNLHLIAIAVAIFGVLTIPFSLLGEDTRAALFRTLNHIVGAGVGIYILFRLSLRPKSEYLQFLLKLLTISGVLLALEYIGNFVLASIQNGIGLVLIDRMTGGLAGLNWGVSNGIAGCLVLTFFSTFGLYRMASINSKLILTCLGIQFIGIFITFSRTSLAIVVGLLAFSILRKIKLKRLLQVRTMIIVVIGVSLSANELSNLEVFNSDEGELFIESRTSSDQITSFNGRTEHWSQYLDLIGHDPLASHGYYSTIYTVGSSGHNQYLTFIYELGVVGLIFSLLILLGAIRSVNAQSILALAVVASAANMFFEDLIYIFAYSIYFWTIFIVASCGSKKCDSGNV